MARDGRDGRHGRDGRPGDPGEPGRNVTAEEARPVIADVVAKAVAELPKRDDIEKLAAASRAVVEDNESLTLRVTLHHLAPLIDARLAEAAAALPRPKDGQDGKSVDMDVVKAIIRHAVLEVTRLWVKPKDGKIGPRGEPGPVGPMPDHKWEGTSLQFEKPNGMWGESVDLRGPPGTSGYGGGAIAPLYSTRVWEKSGAIALASRNLITVPNIVLTTPIGAPQFEDFFVYVDDASATGCSIAASNGYTIDGAATFDIAIVPCTLQFTLFGKNWAKTLVTT